MSSEATPVCLTPKPLSPPLFFVHCDIRDSWEIRTEQNINLTSEEENQIKIVTATDYASGNVQVYSVSRENVCSIMLQYCGSFSKCHVLIQPFYNIL